MRDELLTVTGILIFKNTVIESGQSEEIFYAAVDEYFEFTKPRYSATKNLNPAERRF